MSSPRREYVVEAYRDWLQFTKNWATWAFEPGASRDEFNRQLHDRKSALDLLANEEVRNAVQNYIDNLDLGLAAIDQTYDRAKDPWEQRIDIALAFAWAMRPFRDAMVEAMRKNIGPF